MKTPKVVSRQKRRNAIARIKAGESDTRKEADDLVVDIRTVQRWVDEDRRKDPEGWKAVPESSPPSPDPAASPSSSDVVPGDPDGKNPVLDKAVKAAEGEKRADEPPVGPSDVERAKVEARKSAEEYCVGQYREAKGMLTAVGGMVMGVSLFDPRLEAAAEVSPKAESAIRRNAGQLEGTVRKYAGDGLWALVFVLAMDIVASSRRVWKLAAATRQERAERVEKRRAAMKIVDPPKREEKPEGGA